MKIQDTTFVKLELIVAVISFQGHRETELKRSLWEGVNHNQSY